MTDMVAAYSVTPEALSSAQAVLDRAARVRAFRRQSLPVVRRPALSVVPVASVKWPTIRFLGQCMNDYANYGGAKRQTQWVCTPRLSIREIQIAVCKDYKIKLIDLVSSRRTHNVCLPRHVAMWISRKATTRSYPEIGRQFGGRDHSTGINAFERIERLRLANDRELIEALHRITSALDISEILF